MYSQYYNSSLFEQIPESKISEQKRRTEQIRSVEAKMFRDWFPCELAVGSSQSTDCGFYQNFFLSSLNKSIIICNGFGVSIFGCFYFIHTLVFFSYKRMHRCLSVSSIQVYIECVYEFLDDVQSNIYPKVIFTNFEKY